MKYTIFLCGNSVGYADTLKTLVLNPDVIKKHCDSDIETKKLDIQWMVNTNNAGKVDKVVKVDFVVQEREGLTMLPEGLSYSVVGKSREGPLKTFGFNLINQE